MRKITFTIFALFILLQYAKAQVPTVQDCLGAINITKSIYYETNAYTGQGNYPNEINKTISCLGQGERNDVWYRFIVKSNGLFGFSIVPNVSTDDYDWAVYNLTNNYCSDIFTEPNLEVACNFAGQPGLTGPNGLPGAQNEPLFQVYAGETYVINVSQFSVSPYGYTIVFDSINLLQTGYIEGTVINDIDSNCVLSGNDSVAKNMIIDINNGAFFSSSSYDGVFRHLSDTGFSTLSISPKLYYSQICPLNQSPITVYMPSYTDSVLGVDFSVIPTSAVVDLNVVIHNTPLKSHSSTAACIICNNIGTLDVTDTIWTEYSPFLTLSYCAPSPDTLNGNKIGWYATNFHAQTTRNFVFVLIDWGFTPVGTPYFISCTANPISTDTTPANNFMIVNDSIVGSYDPNAKQVSPAGYGPLGKILPTTPYLDYTIEFQNTGNANADRVVLLDTLDKDLDIASLFVLGASHDFTWDLSGPGVLKFTFDSIDLPYQSIDEPGSHGFAKYRINLKPNLLAGTKIENTARIYFDYNNPIITNTTLNTIDLFLGTNEVNYLTQISMYPNPVDDILNIKFDSNLKGTIEIYTPQGKLVMTNNIASKINVTSLNAGMYFTIITFENGRKYFNRFMKL